MLFRSAQLLAASLATLALGAPAASAGYVGEGKGLFGEGKQVVWGPVTEARFVGQNAVGLGAVSSATATCPSGTQAVSGGFSAPANGTNTLGVYQSYRSSPQTWTVSGVALSANGGAATAIAYCRKTRVTITEVTASTTVPSGAGQTATAAATCDPEPWTSGGFSLTRGPGPFQVAFPQQSLMTGPATSTVQAVNNSTGAQTLTVSVYCASGVKLPKPRSVTSTNSAVGAPTFAANDVSATPSCSPGRKKGKKKGKSAKRKKKRKKQAEALAAGGFSTPPFGTPGNAVTLITESRISGTGWLTRGVNVGPAGTLSVTSQGICR